MWGGNFRGEISESNWCPLWHHISNWWALPISKELSDRLGSTFTARLGFYVQKPHDLNFAYAASCLTTVQNQPGFVLKLSVTRRNEFGRATGCNSTGRLWGRRAGGETLFPWRTEITTPTTPSIGPGNLSFLLLGLISNQAHGMHHQLGKWFP